MDFTFTEEQQAAAEAARGVLAKVTPDGVPSPARVPGAVAEGFDRPLWDRLATAGVVGLTVPRAHGGAGLGAIALCLALREAGRVLARVPLLETGAAALVLGTYGGDAAGRLLPALVRGEAVVTAAAAGPTGHGPAELAVTARPDGDGWVLDGAHTAVPWAHSADHLLLPAHTTEGRPVLALLPHDRAHDQAHDRAHGPAHHRPRPGVSLAEQVSTTGERYGHLTLDGVRARADEMITAEGAWDALRDLLTTGTCALALGLGEAVLERTSGYTAERHQFGHPLATFQAVAVQAADRYMDLRAMEATLWQAAWRLESGADGPLPAAADVAVAKIWAAQGVRRVVQTAHHLHGGAGADTDHPLHRYHAWAKQLELSLGPAAAHEEALGDLLAAHPLT
ncbi:acyl-CoA dehydrogenase [Streptomyces mashuensis]|uniref:Acyl-CoA dehydrogenase n=1 Tax=Streptomyces mashuensis TaxID=33904 RepID=A0A919B413_9ACTN|nr:acyl-CoA dehydrogenase family protein [Streptomyces mashuensis]GHF43577.1 acyl-CoA dehydrogenase [Streptomyces mashuensis]